MKHCCTLILSLFLLPTAYSQQLVSSLREEWGGSSWENDAHTSYIYFANGKEAIRTTRGHFSGEWYNNTLLLSLYDSFGRIKTYTTLTWTGTEWKNALRINHVYDDTYDRLTSVVTAVWVNDEFSDVSRTTKVYNQFSGLLTGDYMDLKDGLTGNWYHQSGYEYTYNAENDLQQAVFSVWDNLLSWVQQRRTTYAYSTLGKVQMSFDELWISNTWRNSRRQQYTFNNAGLLQNLLIEDWSNLSETWRNTQMLDYTYNSDGFEYQVLNRDWSDADQNWENRFLTTNTYGTAYLGVAEQQAVFKFYPNPVAETLHLTFATPAIALVQVTNMLGEIVYTETVSGMSHDVMLSELPAGPYLISVATGGRIETQSIVKQ